jgi:BlaI family transcriptional regulator, penicillinase repressor
MSAAEARLKPTELELEILKVLWRIGPCTARQVLDDLSTRRPMGYTTVLKMLQVMEPKGLVEVDRAERSHLFRAAIEREATLARLVGDLVDRVFDGAAEQVLVHLAKDRRLEKSEIEAVKRRIALARKKEGGRHG